MFRSSYSILSSFLIDLRKKSWRDLLSQGWLLLKKSRVQQAIVLLILTLLFSLILYMRLHKGSISEDFSVVPVVKKSFMVEVKTMGELDAAHSTTIASSVRGDRGKIIHLIPDGVTVGAGELLMKLDPTPFEEKLASLKSQLREQESLSAALKKAVEWEVSQAERDNKTAVFEIESAELELSKVLHGDGPLEIARLKAAMQKTFIKYDEINKYSEDLIALEKEGFLNPSELKNAQKKLTEEEDAYLSAKLQHDSYVNYVFPMLIKKAETLLKQTQIKHEESQKVRGHSIGKAIVELQQTDFSLETLQAEIEEAQRELKLTEILAPTSGIVVHREDFRGGQRRKPRIGDLIVKNQVITDLPDLNFMVVKSRVREVDLYKVAIGKKALIEVDAYPELQIPGTLTSIGVLALPDPSRPSEEKYFEINIALDHSDLRIRPGMTARVTIHSDEVKDGLVIPVHALFQEDQKPYCYVLNTKSQYERREVVVGLHNEEYAEITSNLHLGEKVCLTKPVNIRL